MTERWRAEMPDQLTPMARFMIERDKALFENRELREKVAALELEVEAAHERIAALEARIRELEHSTAHSTARSIIECLESGKLPDGNSDVEEAIKRRIRELTEWRPMETAPRDGTWILVLAPGDFAPVEVMQWNSGLENADGWRCGTEGADGWLPLPSTEGGEG